MKCKITHRGITKEVTIESDESLLESAIKAGVEPPYSCLEGICGTCEAKLLEGTVISPNGEETGPLIRTCMSRPKSDIAFSYDTD